MPSLRDFVKAATGAGLLASSAVATPKSCPVTSSTPLSCQNTTAVADLCCFNAPGGQLLQTQFWDTDPATGPTDSWTIHGLWPDHCDGTFDANCDASRAYTNISAIIKASAPEVLTYMNTYWKDESGNDESFWEHEWSKHGTCISTLEPSCYTKYTPQEEVVEYFNRTVELFKTLPTYTFLSAAGITPSSSKTYTSAQILAALKTPRGVDVAIQCASGALDEVWYFFETRGSVSTGTFVPASPDGSKSDCPATGIKYLPKGTSGGGGTTTTTSTTSGGGTTPTGTPFSGKGTLSVATSSGTTGCLISNGAWYVGGTCATYTAASSGSGFTLTTSKGPCAVTSGSLGCASGNTATVFTASGSDLKGPWYAAAVPSGSTQVAVSTTSKAQAITISWA